MRRLGLIGFGSIAEHGHLPAWLSLPDVEVTAVADVSPARLDRARALLPHAALFDSPRALIAEAAVDGVDICSPPNTHADLILASCERGLAEIVCEKPLVLSEEDYVRVARARRRSGSRLVSVNNWMHSDLHRHVADVLRTGAIGSVRRIELRIGRPDCALGNDGWMPRWRTDLARAGGGIILDHGWHQLYLLLAWMQGPIESVSAITRTADSRHFPVEDEALLEMRFPGAHGCIELSWTAHGRSNDGLITGSRGAVTIQDDRIVVQSGGGYHSLPFRGKLTESSYHPDWFAQMFRRTILDQSREEADRNFAEAGVLVSAICAAYRSAHRSGAPCSPTYPTGDAVSAALTARMDSIYERGIGGGAAASQPVV